MTPEWSQFNEYNPPKTPKKEVLLSMVESDAIPGVWWCSVVPAGQKGCLVGVQGRDVGCPVVPPAYCVVVPVVPEGVPTSAVVPAARRCPVGVPAVRWCLLQPAGVPCPLVPDGVHCLLNSDTWCCPMVSGAW